MVRATVVTPHNDPHYTTGCASRTRRRSYYHDSMAGVRRPERFFCLRTHSPSPSYALLVLPA